MEVNHPARFSVKIHPVLSLILFIISTASTEGIPFYFTRVRFSKYITLLSKAFQSWFFAVTTCVQSLILEAKMVCYWDYLVHLQTFTLCLERRFAHNAKCISSGHQKFELNGKSAKKGVVGWEYIVYLKTYSSRGHDHAIRFMELTQMRPLLLITATTACIKLVLLMVELWYLL